MGPEIIFIKFILVPLVVALAMVGFALYAKANELLRPGRLMIYVGLQGLVLVLPALWGLMTFRFVPNGLVAVQLSFFALGILGVLFSQSNVFASIGLGEKPWLILLVVLIALLVGSWGFFLVFEYLSSLGYSLLVALTSVWFLLPFFYLWGRKAYVTIPPAYYTVMDPWETGPFDNRVWEEVDYLRLMNISLRIKQSATDRSFSSYPVRAPSQVPVAQWFSRYIKDQRIKFPNAPIEMEENGEPYCWIFYTTKFLVFNRPISPDKTFADYKIKNKSVVYARRVDKVVTTQ